MLKQLIVLLGLSLLIPNSLSAQEGKQRAELALSAIYFASSPQQISGAALEEKKLLVVSDDDETLWQASEKDHTLTLKPYLKLNTLKNFTDYLEGVKAAFQGVKIKKWLDLEGISTCEGDIYLINELPRDVLKVSQKARTLEKLPLELSGYPQLKDGGNNAGFEGITVDCENKIMYLAKEREPRQILVVDLKTMKLMDHWDVPTSNRGGQRVINPWNGENVVEIQPDFADLAFDRGFLYALERNTFEIAKIDPKTKTVVNRVSYWQTEKPLYEHFEPFGLAEALILTKDQILIGFDNNGEFLSTNVQREYKKKGHGGTIARFKRPSDF